MVSRCQPAAGAMHVTHMFQAGCLQRTDVSPDWPNTSLPHPTSCLRPNYWSSSSLIPNSHPYFWLVARDAQALSKVVALTDNDCKASVGSSAALNEPIAPKNEQNQSDLCWKGGQGASSPEIFVFSPQAMTHAMGLGSLLTAPDN